MATIHLSRRAEGDLLEIGSYTLRIWGPTQTFRYLDELEISCERLAGMPAIGRLCEHIRPGLRRLEQGQHVIFYRPHEGGILVSRILHKRMLPEHHDMED